MALHPRLAFSTLGCADLDLNGALDLAHRHGIGGIELRCLNGRPIEPDDFPTHFPDVAWLRTQCAALGVHVHMLGTSVRLLTADLSDHATLLGFGYLADAIGCPWLRVFDGGSAQALPTADEAAAVAQWFAGWNELRRTHGINAQIAVETHDALTTCPGLQRMRQAVPQLPILWDLHHTWRAGTDPQAFGLAVAPQLVHVHLKDSISQPSARKPFTYVAPGQGEFDWAGSVRLLAALGFKGSFSFEWERHWHPELDPLQIVLPKFVQMTANADAGASASLRVPPAPRR